MSHIVDCPLTKLNGGLSRLHSADETLFRFMNQLWFMTRIREETITYVHKDLKESPLPDLKRLMPTMHLFTAEM